MYIDPNTGGLLFQVLAVIFSVFSGAVLLFSGKIRMYLAKLRRRQDERGNETSRTDDDPPVN